MSALVNPLFWLAVAVAMFLLSAVLQIWPMREGFKRMWHQARQGRDPENEYRDLYEKFCKAPLPMFMAVPMLLCFYALLAMLVTFFVDFSR